PALVVNQFSSHFWHYVSPCATVYEVVMLFFWQSYLLPHHCCGAFIRISLLQLEFLVSPLCPSLRGF
uniref:Uncharacterized protein n=1 Tax=Junco hyemalis TaxID=40217 RepID=A0A8C5NR54_JUNHY